MTPPTVGGRPISPAADRPSHRKPHMINRKGLEEIADLIHLGGETAHQRYGVALPTLILIDAAGRTQINLFPQGIPRDPAAMAELTSWAALFDAVAATLVDEVLIAATDLGPAALRALEEADVPLAADIPAHREAIATLLWCPEHDLRRMTATVIHRRGARTRLAPAAAVPGARDTEGEKLLATLLPARRAERAQTA
jgi:hypothetical protein